MENCADDIRLRLTAGVLRLWEDALTKVKTRSVETIASGLPGGIICNQLRIIEGLVRRTGLEKARAITLLGQVFLWEAARPTVGLAAVGRQSSIAACDSAIHRKWRQENALSGRTVDYRISSVAG